MRRKEKKNFLKLRKKEFEKSRTMQEVWRVDFVKSVLLETSMENEPFPLNIYTFRSESNYSYLVAVYPFGFRLYSTEGIEDMQDKASLRPMVTLIPSDFENTEITASFERQSQNQFSFEIWYLCQRERGNLMIRRVIFDPSTHSLIQNDSSMLCTSIDATCNETFITLLLTKENHIVLASTHFLIIIQNGKIHSTKELESVITCVYSIDYMIFIGLFNGTVNIMDFSGKIFRSESLHKSPVTFIGMINSVVYSGSAEGKLCVLDLNNRKEKGKTDVIRLDGSPIFQAYSKGDLKFPIIVLTRKGLNLIEVNSNNKVTFIPIKLTNKIMMSLDFNCRLLVIFDNRNMIFYNI